MEPSPTAELNPLQLTTTPRPNDNATSARGPRKPTKSSLRSEKQTSSSSKRAKIQNKEDSLTAVKVATTAFLACVRRALVMPLASAAL
jgi:hypothetical protein